MEDLEAHCTEIAPVLERKQDNWNRGSELDELVRDAADEEPSFKTRIEAAEKLIVKISQDKLDLTREQEQRMCDARNTISRLDDQNYHEKGLRNCLILEKEKMKLLQQFLDKLRFKNNSDHGKSIYPGLSKEQKAKQKLNSQMLHGTNSLAEEKWLLKEIKRSQKVAGSASSSENEDLRIQEKVGSSIKFYQTWWSHQQMEYICNQRSIVYHRRSQRPQLKTWHWQGTRFAVLLQMEWNKSIANAYYNALDAGFAYKQEKVLECLCSIKYLEEQIRLTGEEIDGLTRLLLAMRPKLKQSEKELKVIERDIQCLEKKLPLLEQRKHKADQCVFKLRIQLTKSNYWKEKHCTQ